MSVNITKLDFGNLEKRCRNKRDNEKCRNQNDCKEENCIKRHPKICRSYNSYGWCRNKELCAYQHNTKSTNPKVEILENEIKHRREEINILRLNVTEIM